jgi:hypothetical protein
MSCEVASWGEAKTTGPIVATREHQKMTVSSSDFSIVEKLCQSSCCGNKEQQVYFYQPSR